MKKNKEKMSGSELVRTIGFALSALAQELEISNNTLLRLISANFDIKVSNEDLASGVAKINCSHNFGANFERRKIR